MRTSRWLALLPLLILSCLSPKPETDSSVFFHEGSRLKANYIDYGDGAVQFTGWFDTTLRVNCSFTVFSSGEITCIPNGSASSGEYFEDGLCARPLVSVNNFPCPAAAVPSVAIQRSANPTCSDETSFYNTPRIASESAFKLGPPINLSTIYVKSTTGCTATPVPVGVDLFRRGALIPLSTFVRAQVKLLPRGPKNALAVYAGEDGSQERRQPRFGALPCQFWPAEDGMVCIPSSNAFPREDLFTDPSCTTPNNQNIAFARNDLCFLSNFVQRIRYQDPQQCTFKVEISTQGAEQTIPPLFIKSGANCVPYDTNQLKAFSVGSPVDLKATFGILQRYALGTGRIQARFYGTGPAEALSPINDIFDAQLMSSCRSVRFSDGVTRCIDSTVQSTGYYFDDPACGRNPLVFIGASRCGGSDNAPARALLVPPPVTCGPAPDAVGLFSLKLYTGQVYQRMNATTCVAVNQPGKAFQLDQQLDLSGFATVKTVQR